VRFSVWISRGIRRRLVLFRGIELTGDAVCSQRATMSDPWSPSSWSSKPIAQVQVFYPQKLIVDFNSFQGCCISRSTTSCKASLPHRPRCPSPTFFLSRVLSKLSTLPPMVTPSEVGLIVLDRKLHGSPQRLMPSFVQDRTSTLSARPRSTQRGLFASRW
jgi:hypothetical protein